VLIAAKIAQFRFKPGSKVMIKRTAIDRLSVAAEQNIKARDYWLRKLSGDLEKSNFPFDSKKKGARKIDTFRFRFSSQDFSRIMGLSTSDYALNAILTSSLVVLLYKYTGNPDIIVGAPVYQQDIKVDLINTVLVLRNRVEDNMTFKEILQQVGQTIVEATQNYNYPVEMLPKQLNMPSPQDEFPFFDTAIMLENIHNREYLQYTDVNIFFRFKRTADSIEGEVEYNTYLYRRRTVEQITAHFRQLIRNGLGNVDSQVRDINILSSEEREQLVYDFNHTGPGSQVESPAGNTLHELFEKQAAENPGNTAAAYEERELSYEELNRKSNQLARLLKKKGLRQDSIAAIILERSLEIIIAVMAVFKSGASYLPIDPSNPGKRIDYMLKDSSAHLLITQPGVKERIDTGVEMIDIYEPCLFSGDDRNIEHTRDSTQLAYVIYTSGSTGKPKGVMVQHDQLLNATLAWRQAYKLDRMEINLLQIASFSFDVAVGDLARTLPNGGKLVLCPQHAQADLVALYQLITKHRVTLFEATPSLVLPLMDYIYENRLNTGDLELLILGSESCGIRDFEKLVSRFGQRMRIINSYGVTEATIDTSCFEVCRENIPTSGSVPIGTPLLNMKCYILDNARNPKPMEVPGELYIGGKSVSRGYLNRVPLTSEKFVPNPFQQGERMYRTGDLARWLPNGMIQFLGRIDHQVKVRGYRIELGEIERQLLKHQHIKEAVVIHRDENGGSGRQEENGQKYLCAYLVPAKRINPSALRDFLSKELPDYMIPAHFLELEKIPQTINGKIDRKALPEPVPGHGTIPFISEDILEKTALSLAGKVREKNIFQDKLLPMESYKDRQIHNLPANGFSCYIIGETVMPAKCAEIFMQHGHKVLGMISADPRVTQWAKENHIAARFPGKKVEMISFLKEKPFDYLFSIWNTSIIPAEILALPRKDSFNFHGGILPDYAGMFISTWAILTGLEKHGITWHVMEEGIDTGDIVKQVPVDIDRNDTSKTLHLKCFEAGIRSFAQLIEELAEGKETRKKQDLDRRHYFGLYKRPASGCLLSFNWEAHKIEALARALDFGDHENLIGMPKIAVGGDFFLLPEISLTGSPTQQPPGTLTTVDDRSLSIAAADQEVKIHQIFNADGREIPIPDFLAGFHISAGYRFVDLDEKKSKRIDEYNSIICKYEDYWVRRLRSLEPPDLPFNFSKTPGTDTHTIFEKKFPIPMEIKNLNEILPQPELLVAAFTAYLSRITGMSALDVGYSETSIQREINGLEGIFSKFVPLHVNLEPGIGFKDFCKSMEKNLKQMRKRKTFIRDILVRNFLPRSPWEETLAVRLEIAENLENYEPPDCKTLYITIPENGDQCICFHRGPDEENARQLLRHFSMFLQEIIANPSGKISAYSLLDKKDRHQLLYQFNDTHTQYARDKAMPELFEDQVKKTPGKIALILAGHGGPDLFFTYEALNEKSNQLAHLLKKQGVKPGTIVGLMVERSLQLVTGIMGIWKAGGAYLPIDLQYPSHRVKYVLEDCSSGILLYGNKKPGSYTHVFIDISAPEVQWEEPRNPTRINTPADPAVVFYTSGTTGKPKGVILEHTGIINHLQAKINDMQVTGTSIVVENAPFTFDISVWQLFVALITGGKTVIYPDELSLDPAQFLSRLEKDRATILEVIPPYLSSILTALESEPRELQSLDYLVVTGEEVKPNLVKKWFEKYPAVKIMNAYGPTEASDDITHYIMDKAPQQERISIGCPLQNFTVYIIDKHMNLCPVGVTGELCVSGVGLARGYLNRVELTAERFAANPFLSNRRMYRTGDLAKWFPDGNIDFLGRMDYQVKVRGFRIELGEIENCLSSISNVREVAIVVKENNNREKYLCAFVASKKNLIESDLREYLTEKLPLYMVPSYFVQLEKMPLTANGKINRKLLEALEIDPGEQKKYMAPESEIEVILTEVWSEVLGIEKHIISINDNFFELGGHSLKATVMTVRLHKKLNIKIPLVEIFKSPTIKGLAKYVTRALPREFTPIPPVPIKDYYYASPAQKGLYILQQMNLETTAYNIVNMFVPEQPPDKKKLQETIEKLIKRHESLRTSFIDKGGETVQVIHDDVEFEIECYDLDTKKREEARRENKNHHSTIVEILDHFIRPFDLSKAPLLRVGLMRTADKKHILVADMHHIISDGISHQVLRDDFLMLYKGKELPKLTLQYKDFSEWQNSKEEKEKLNLQKQYWLKEFAGEIPVLNIKTDYPRPETRSFAGNRVNFVVGSDETDALKRYAEKNGTTLYILLLTVFYILLSKLSGQEDIVVGTAAAGRRHADLEKIIGLFVNTLALRNYPQNDKSFKPFLSEVTRRTLEAFDNQDFPFEQLLEKVLVKRDLSRSPLFDAAFGLQNIAHRQEEMVPPANQILNAILPESVEYKRSKFEIMLFGKESGEELFLSIEYCTKLFKKKTIETFIDYYKKILTMVMKDENVKLKDINITGHLSAPPLKMLQEEQGEFGF
jgi:amino acid adenylation domain-containing protein